MCSHEARVFEALRQAVDGLAMHELEEAMDGDKNATKVGQSQAFKSKWIIRTKGTAATTKSYRCSRPTLTELTQMANSRRP